MIPLIGQSQQQEVNVEISTSPPMLTINQGIIAIRLPLSLSMAKNFRSGLDQLVSFMEAQAAPLTGDGSLYAAINSRGKEAS